MKHGLLSHELLVFVIIRRETPFPYILEDVVDLLGEAEVLLPHPVEDYLHLIVECVVAEQLEHRDEHLTVCLLGIVTAER